MPTSLIVVDDFLSTQGAWSLRNAGLGLTCPDLQGACPGRNSQERLHPPVSCPRSRNSSANNCGRSNRCIRMASSASRAGDIGRGRVHIDGPVEWSGILYLGRPEDCRGGTECSRHLPTGAERAPFDARELQAMGLPSYDAVQDEPIARDGNDPSKWELTMRVPMRFNRLVLLGPWMWHSAGEAFGRLVHPMFFTRA